MLAVIWVLAQSEVILPPVVTDTAVPATGWVLLGGAVWMLMTGRLVPSGRVAKIEQDAQYWRDLAVGLLHQNRELMVSAKVATKVLDAMDTEAGDRT